MDATKRAALCARVSTVSQVQGTSLETQVDECSAYARSRGWEVVGTYIDGGVSGTLGSRPGLDRLMADCRSGLIDAVIVSKHDRFGRSFRHTVTLIGELGDIGVEFVSIAEHIDDSPSGRFQRNMLLSVAEFERERILERTTAGMEATARAGRWPAGTAPFGWRIAKAASGHSTLEINPSEAAVWERMVAMLVDQRLSTLETARALNAAGIIRRKGTPWNANSVWNLVRDTTCLSGTWTYRRTDHRQSRKTLGPPITMSVPPILTPERHEALLAVIAARSWSRRQVHYPWLLSGVLVSPHGRLMWGRVSARGVRNYACPGKIAADGGGGGGCGCNPVHADDLDAAVWSAVASALSRPEQLVALAEEQAERTVAAEAAGTEDIAAIDRRIARLETAAGERLAQALAAGVDPRVAATASAAFSGQLDQLRRQRAMVASWAADAASRRSRAELIADLVDRSAASLVSGGSVEARRRVFDVLDIRVAITDWAPCPSCAGKGKRTGGRVGENCPACHGMRYQAGFSLSGSLPGTAAAPHALPVRFAVSA